MKRIICFSTLRYLKWEAVFQPRETDRSSYVRKASVMLKFFWAKHSIPNSCTCLCLIEVMDAGKKMIFSFIMFACGRLSVWNNFYAQCINCNVSIWTPNFGSPPTVEPLGVILGSAQRWQAAQAAVDGGVSAREVHGRGSVKLPAGGDEGGGVVEGVVGTPSHPADLIMDLCQICQLQYTGKKKRMRLGTKVAG